MNTAAASITTPQKNANSQKRKTRVDFNKLSWGTLRKYQYFFRVKGGDEGLKRDKAAVVDAV